jgi:hypothetical protein
MSTETIWETEGFIIDPVIAVGWTLVIGVFIVILLWRERRKENDV